MRYFFINFNTGHLWLPTSHWTAPAWLMGCHAIPLVTNYFPPNPVTVNATDLRECLLLSGIFYLALLPAVFKASLGAGSSTSRSAGASCWSSKHSPSLTICLNHSNPQKIYMARFYLRVRACQSWNINLFGELVLQNTSL